MSKRKEDWSLSEWRDYYEKLQQRAYMQYQETGTGRYDSQQYQYSKIVDAFNAYISYRDDEDKERIRRKHNIDAYVDRYVIKETYSKAEVLKMLHDVSMF